MEDQKGVDGFVDKNKKWLIIIVFAGGMFFARTEFVSQAIQTLEGRVNKKTVIQNELIETVTNIEKEMQYNKGFSDGHRQATKECNSKDK